MADTQPPGAAEAGPRERPSSLRGGVCATCGQRFGGDARFCPYDGQPLVAMAAERPPDGLLRTVLDQRYEVLQILGEGGMGTVYRARHTKLGRFFALKVLKSELSNDADLAKRFIREAKAAAAIAHPSVVQICDFGELPTGQPYFVMELLEGISLSTLIWQRGPLTPAVAIRVLRQVAEGLGAAHEAGIVHRDLKPDNIHIADIGGRELVKVLDFGLAKVAGASKLTKNGIVYGTPHYMSPEQAAGEPVNHRTDIYALGVVMYETLTGRVPFDADTYMGILTKHLYVQPIPPSQVLVTANLGGLEDITLRCLEKKPGKRFASMSELLRAFDRVVELSESGQLQLRPAAVRSAPKSVLADQFRLAERRESKTMAQEPLRRAGWRWGASGAAVGAVIVVAWVAAASFRSAANRSAPVGIVERVTAPDAVPRGVEPDVRPVENPRAVRPAASAGGEPRPEAGSASAPQSSGAALGAPPTSSRAARGPGQRSGAVKAISPRNKRLSGGEIIDPWAK